jgi:hypothetical protein
MRRRSAALGELRADQITRTGSAAPDARAFVGWHAATLPARTLDERHLARRTSGRHGLAEDLRRIALEPDNAATCDTSRLRSQEPQRSAMVLHAGSATRRRRFAVRNCLTRAAVGEDLAVLLRCALGLDATVGRSTRSTTRPNARVCGDAAPRARDAGGTRYPSSRTARCRAARRARISGCVTRARGASGAGARFCGGRRAAAARGRDRENHQDQVSQSNSPLRPFTLALRPARF